MSWLGWFFNGAMCWGAFCGAIGTFGIAAMYNGHLWDGLGFAVVAAFLWYTGARCLRPGGWGPDTTE
jgi:hypothetical protein